PRERARPLAESGQRPVREGGVHLPVAVPPCALETWFIDRVVEQRPQRRVGEPVVVITEPGGGEPDRQQLDAEVGQRRGDPPRAADPGAGLARHHRPQRSDQPAGRQLPAPRWVSRASLARTFAPQAVAAPLVSGPEVLRPVPAASFSKISVISSTERFLVSGRYRLMKAMASRHKAAKQIMIQARPMPVCQTGNTSMSAKLATQ